MPYVLLLEKGAVKEEAGEVCYAMLRMHLVCRRILAHITHLHDCKTYADVC